ncbi:hypothetical protein [Nocardia xishanensis]|uniref:hypothetical protein n=1 Tax=Nocardia xishanensis TaxID=238964 RepID=UPI003F540333
MDRRQRRISGLGENLNEMDIDERMVPATQRRASGLGENLNWGEHARYLTDDGASAGPPGSARISTVSATSKHA